MSLTQARIFAGWRNIEQCAWRNHSDILIEVFPIQHVMSLPSRMPSFLFFDAQQSTRALFLSQNIFQSVGTSEQADVLDAGDLFEKPPVTVST